MLSLLRGKDNNTCVNCKVELAKYALNFRNAQNFTTFVNRMKKLFLFNPENDMALASGSPYYMAPASAKKMAADLSTLPMWYADAGSDVWVADARQVEWMASECRLSLPVSGVMEATSGYDEISAWAWSPALLHRLETSGVQSGIPSFCNRIEEIRTLSSRRIAVDLLPKLRMDGTEGESLWLTSLENIEMFALKHRKVLLKAPWSGSGKGIQPLCGLPDDNLKGWAKRIIASQGGVVGEPFYQKVIDFAMEFKVTDHGVERAGYSLFEADARGIYKENLLATDEAIEGKLSEYISRDLLDQIWKRLQEELYVLLHNSYRGYLGVDMMVVQTDEGYAIHPCVEVNLRMNMGVVSRLLFDRFISSDACGRYVIEFYPRSGEALKTHREMMEKYPLTLHEGKIKEGYLSLTPVFEDTNYQIYMVI